MIFGSFCLFLKIFVRAWIYLDQMVFDQIDLAQMGYDQVTCSSERNRSDGKQ